MGPPGSRLSSAADFSSAEARNASETIGSAAEASPHFIRFLLDGLSCDLIVCDPRISWRMNCAASVLLSASSPDHLPSFFEPSIHIGPGECRDSAGHVVGLAGCQNRLTRLFHFR